MAILAILLLLGIPLVFLLFLLKGRRGQPPRLSKGEIGEELVRRELMKLAPETYFTFHDLLLLAGEGHTSQIDHVVVSRYGVFVIETKNYSGYIYGNQNSRVWTQIIKGHREQFQNPIWQNHGHIKTLQQLLQDVGADVPFHSIIAFGHNVTSLKVEASHDVVYIRDVVKTIRNYVDEKLPPEMVQAINQRMQAGNITDEQDRLDHISKIQANLKEREEKVQQGVCPKCGGQLVLRKGKYGEFLGCTGYPKCKFKNAVAVPS